MRKLIVIHYQDENYDVGGLVRFLIKMFNQEKYRNILREKYELDVITSKDIIFSLKKTEEEFLKEISADMNNFGSVFLGIHPYGFHKIVQNLNKHNRDKFKFFAWTDDPHYFAYETEDVKNKKCSVQKYSKNFDPILLNKFDYLITPSPIYFKNLNITKYDEKLINFFYFLNPEWADVFVKNNYKERQNKIILSGQVGAGYTSRIEFNSLCQKNKNFEDLIYKLPHPGYNNNNHMTEINYYMKLAEFKGAFVGHYAFPINYLLAKHIEVLMCGCIGFFEPTPLLESQLGLKENIHYVSCYKDGKIIDDYQFYASWIGSQDGEKIAKCGQEYIIDNFGEKHINKLLDLLKK